MYKAEELCEMFRTEWRAACPPGPLLSNKAQTPFHHAMIAAQSLSIEETHTFTFSDGSVLECHTDRNGMRSMTATQVIKA